MSGQDKMIEIQASYVQNFLKQKLGAQTKLSSQFRKDFSSCLSIFIYHLMVQQRQAQKKKNKKLQKEDILQVLNQIGFDEISNMLEDYNWQAKINTTKKKTKADNTEVKDNDHNDNLEEKIQDIKIISDRQEQEYQEDRDSNNAQEFDENDFNEFDFQENKDQDQNLLDEQEMGINEEDNEIINQYFDDDDDRVPMETEN